MGSGGPSTVSSRDFDELEKRIAARLGELVGAANRIVFACEELDLKSLTNHMTRSGLVDTTKAQIACGPDAARFLADLNAVQLLVTFTDLATSTAFLDAMAAAAFDAHKQGIHARAQPAALVPSKVRAYRWRAMSWDELVVLLR